MLCQPRLLDRAEEEKKRKKKQQFVGILNIPASEFDLTVWKIKEQERKKRNGFILHSHTIPDRLQPSQEELGI